FLPIQHRNFAEHLSRLQHREDDLSSLLRWYADAHSAAQDRHHAGARRAHKENGLTRPELPHPGAPHERIPFTCHQAPKQDATCKLSASVLQAILRERCHWMSPGLDESGYRTKPTAFNDPLV